MTAYSFSPADWVRSPHPLPQADFRLFCLPYTGGDASLFQEWPVVLPDGLRERIEICSLSLPRRDHRLRERQLFTSLSALIDFLALSLFTATYSYILFLGSGCSITVMGATGSLVLSTDELSQWQAHTSQVLRLSMFSGNHFFVHDVHVRKQLLASICDTIRPRLEQPGTAQRETWGREQPQERQTSASTATEGWGLANELILYGGTQQRERG